MGRGRAIFSLTMENSVRPLIIVMIQQSCLQYTEVIVQVTHAITHTHRLVSLQTERKQEINLFSLSFCTKLAPRSKQHEERHIQRTILKDQKIHQIHYGGHQTLLIVHPDSGWRNNPTSNEKRPHLGGDIEYLNVFLNTV